MRGLIMLLIIVITMPTGRTLSKPTRASHERVKKLCGENQYNASSNFTLNELVKNPCIESKYNQARSTYTCDCQFSANSARFLQIHKENYHYKREVNVHSGDENVEASNECVKGKFKLKNKFTLSKHRGD